MKPYTMWMVRMLLSCILITPSILFAADEAVIQDLQTDVTVTKGKADQNAQAIESLKGGLPAERDARIAADEELRQLINAIPEGPPGPQGEPGPAGPPGSSGAADPVVIDAICGLYEAMGMLPPELCAPYKNIFISSQTYDGNLGGLAGADAICQQLATDAGLVGTYKAWLSDTVSSAATHMTHYDGPYMSVENTQSPSGRVLIADNWNDLVDATLVNGIRYDENGVDVGSYPYVWTSTDEFGQSLLPDNCSDWTQNTIGGYGTIGRPDSTDYRWTRDDYFTRYGCQALNHLYCVQQ